MSKWNLLLIGAALLIATNLFASGDQVFAVESEVETSVEFWEYKK